MWVKERPRIISSQDPRVTAFTGPPITVTQNYLHHMWNGQQVPILFAAGHTVEELPAFFRLNVPFRRKLSETDMLIYDATVGQALQELFLDIIHAIGFEGETMFWELRRAESDWSVGRGVSGSRFLSPPNRKSGAADTCFFATHSSMLSAICLPLH